MSEEFKKIESLLDKAKEYVNTRIAQIKLSIAEKISKILSLLIAGFIVTLVFFFFLFFGSFAAAIAIGNMLGQAWLGFLIISGVWLLLGIVIWKSREKILRIPIMNSIIDSLFNRDKDHEEDQTTP